jgi:lipopolysaccharide export system permease protein
MPTILSMSLFIAILSVLTRMFKDSEMVIWFGSGQGLASLLKPLMRFAWPILVIIFMLSFFILPWAFGRIEDLRDKFEKRGDIARIQPGQFQESANGDRVFFIEKNDTGTQTGNNVFMATNEQGKQTVTSARSGRIEVIGPDKFLVLQTGQRLERMAGKPDLTVSIFEHYGTRVGADDGSARSYVPSSSMSSLALMQSPNLEHQAELSWRIGLVLAAINFIVIGIAASGMNPRVGTAANLGFAFLIFVIYFNMLVLGKNWIESGQVHFVQFLIVLHGGVLVLSVLWLLKRNSNWSLRRPAAARALAHEGKSA